MIYVFANNLLDPKNEGQCLFLNYILPKITRFLLSREWRQRNFEDFFETIKFDIWMNIWQDLDILKNIKKNLSKKEQLWVVKKNP